MLRYAGAGQILLRSNMTNANTELEILKNIFGKLWIVVHRFTTLLKHDMVRATAWQFWFSDNLKQECTVELTPAILGRHKKI